LGHLEREVMTRALLAMGGGTTHWTSPANVLGTWGVTRRRYISLTLESRKKCKTYLSRKTLGRGEKHGGQCNRAKREKGSKEDARGEGKNELGTDITGYNARKDGSSKASKRSRGLSSRI